MAHAPAVAGVLIHNTGRAAPGRMQELVKSVVLAQQDIPLGGAGGLHCLTITHAVHVPLAKLGEGGMLGHALPVMRENSPQLLG